MQKCARCTQDVGMTHDLDICVCCNKPVCPACVSTRVVVCKTCYPSLRKAVNRMQAYHAFYTYRDPHTHTWQMGILCFAAENDIDAWEEADRRLSKSRLLEFSIRDIAAVPAEES